MGYIPWYERIEQEKAEREGKKINKEVSPNKKLSNQERRRQMYQTHIHMVSLRSGIHRSGYS